MLNPRRAEYDEARALVKCLEGDGCFWEYSHSEVRDYRSAIKLAEIHYEHTGHKAIAEITYRKFIGSET